MTILITIGKYGGFYYKGGKNYCSKRLCLGWIAFTYIGMDDWWVTEALAAWEKQQNLKDMRE